MFSQMCVNVSGCVCVCFLCVSSQIFLENVKYYLNFNFQFSTPHSLWPILALISTTKINF